LLDEESPCILKASVDMVLVKCGHFWHGNQKVIVLLSLAYVRLPRVEASTLLGVRIQACTRTLNFLGGIETAPASPPPPNPKIATVQGYAVDQSGMLLWINRVHCSTALRDIALIVLLSGIYGIGNKPHFQAVALTLS